MRPLLDKEGLGVVGAPLLTKEGLGVVGALDKEGLGVVDAPLLDKEGQGVVDAPLLTKEGLGVVELGDTPEQSQAQSLLQLSGLVVKRGSGLQVYNRVYAEVFTVAWVEKALRELRPYADALTAWSASGHQDESRLLRGQALQEALQWAEGKNLDQHDYQLLTASQQLARRVQAAALKVQWQWRLIGVLGVSIVVASGLAIWGYVAQEQARKSALVAKQNEQLAEKQKALAIRAVINLTYDVINKVADVSGTTVHLQAIFENNIGVLQQIEDLSPDTPEAQREKSTNLGFMGDVWLRLGKTDEALTAYQKSLVIRERLAAQDPNSAQAQRDVSISYNKLGNIYLAQGQTESALTAYQKSLVIRERLAAQDPNSAQAQRDLTMSYAKLGVTQRALKDKKQALQYFEQALKIAEPLAKQDPTNQQKQKDVENLKGDIAKLRGGE